MMLKASHICLVVVLLAGATLVARVPLVNAADPQVHTVCAAGCDYATIQAALDDSAVVAGAVVQVTDAVHTEAGITVHKSVTIQGQGPDKTIVQAHDTPEESLARVFVISEGVTVTIQHMTIRHGRTVDKGEAGGGIKSNGTLTVRNCLVTGNSATGGGGISSDGSLIVIDSTFRDNVARGDGPPGEWCGGGGGIKSSSGTLQVINSTFTGNRGGQRSKGLGGGIRTGCQCTAEIVNCTISGNQAAEEGGGIAASGTVQIVNCTITENSSVTGGGLWVRNKVSLENTIIANNVRGKDCIIFSGGHEGLGSLVVNTNNLIGNGNCDADFTGDPRMGPLADNGGATWTHALLPSSPAIDVVPAISCTLTTDQRGLPRPVACTSPDTPGDLGAFEVQVGECVPPTPTALPSATPVPPTREPTSVPATPTPAPVQTPSNDLLPVWGLLGVLILTLAGLVIFWLRRRS